MNKRHIVAGIMFLLAFVLWFLATVRADEVGYYQLSDFVIISIGLLLGVGALPVSGDLKSENDESEEIYINDEYTVTLDVTEQSLDGSYTSQPHTYMKSYPSDEAAKDGIKDLFWECIEIECISSGNVYVEISIEKNGEYYDHDETEFKVQVVHTDEPSRYFLRTGSPVPMSVNRAQSNCFAVK